MAAVGAVGLGCRGVSILKRVPHNESSGRVQALRFSLLGVSGLLKRRRELFPVLVGGAKSKVKNEKRRTKKMRRKAFEIGRMLIPIVVCVPFVIIFLLQRLHIFIAISKLAHVFSISLQMREKGAKLISLTFVLVVSVSSSLHSPWRALPARLLSTKLQVVLWSRHVWKKVSPKYPEATERRLEQLGRPLGEMAGK